FGYDGIGANPQLGADCNGHGTHVAGTIGGKTVGVAKDVSLVSVRIFDCSGSSAFSTIIAGMDWVVANRKLPAVANLSLGGGASLAVDMAIQRLIESGVITVVAAGNDGKDACSYSPARAVNAITVGAAESSDARAFYSNYGSCVDLFAPGTAITSAWFSDSNAYNTISGTSMATPHVVGVAALQLETRSDMRQSDLRDLLRSSIG
ncbi:MAG: S8 family peptidase, partial [Bdellovibrionales bacterium]|nr:S8 family peptidase [Bdellovibrionales bacterium]